MLFDPKWKAREGALTRKSLISWLEKKRADKPYHYIACGRCMLANYFRAMGFRQVKVEAGEFQHAESFGPVKLPRAFIHIAAGHPRTYGGALERARG